MIVSDYCLLTKTLLRIKTKNNIYILGMYSYYKTCIKPNSFNKIFI